MNKAELVQKLMEKAGGHSKAEAERYLDSFVEVVTETLNLAMKWLLLVLVHFYQKREQLVRALIPKPARKSRLQQ